MTVTRLSVAILALGVGPAEAAPPPPFSYWYTNQPAVVARGWSSVFDVLPSTLDDDRLFMTFWGYPGGVGSFGVEASSIDRSFGFIQPLDDINDREENQLWLHLFLPGSGPHFPKALDIVAEDTNRIVIAVACEQGRVDGDGSVELVSVARFPSNAVTSTMWKDLTGERLDGGGQYHTEGIAVDRRNRRVLVVTDDGDPDPPFPPRRQGFRVYTYDPTTFMATGTLTNVALLASADAHNAVALTNGTFLVAMGAAVISNGVWKVDPATGTTELILGRADIEEHGLPGTAVAPVMDLMVHRDYLYLLQTQLYTTGPDFSVSRLLAFRWDASACTVVDREADGILDLNALYRSTLGIDAGSTGLGVTRRGELLISSYSWHDCIGSVVGFTALPDRHGAVLIIK